MPKSLRRCKRPSRNATAANRRAPWSRFAPKDASATGGTGLQACSGDMLLEALVACAGVTLKAVATALGIDLREGRVLAEGDLDFRGTLGVAKDAPVGFRSVRLRFVLDTDASEEQQKKLLELTERYCVVLQTIRKSPEILVTRSAELPRD